MTSSAYATVNLNAVRHNIQVIRKRAQGARVMSVIKANAYGHGLKRIIPALTEVDGVAVARVDEGVVCRLGGFIRPITVLEGFICKDELLKVQKHDLNVVIHDWHQLELLKQCQIEKPLSVWLKVDTGMNRLGFAPEEFAEVYNFLSHYPGIRQPISLMTHLSSADLLDRPETHQQIATFKKLTDGLPGDKSIANSAGVIAWSEALSDWIRPGIMLYGVSPFAHKTGEELGLRPVMTLHSSLISVKKIQPGQRVGYAGTWECNEPTVLGIVAIGYGDGYSRYAVNGTPVLVNQIPATLVGRVSMDMIGVNLGLHSTARAGDPVTLWGEGLPVENIARYANTIPYTLLCGVTQRVVIKTTQV